MASNIIKVTIDVVADKAATSLKSFKSSLADAEGGFGKMKVAGSAAFDSIKANAANMAVAAGGALVAFAAKAVGEFQALALAAGKFSDATGIAVEDASRWIEVAGDIGVSGEAVQGAFQKMNKAIADGKLDEFAADIVRAKDGTVDASATFENLVTKIGAIKDPTERASAAQKAFGKGYAEIAEMMEMSAGDLEAALKGVSDSKVIDESELGKARQFRDAMDNLRDKTEDLALTLGEALVPALTDVAEVAGAVGDALGTELPGGIKVIDALVEPIAGKFRAAGDSIQQMKGDLYELEGPAKIIAERLAATAVETEAVTAETAASTAMYSEFAAGMADAGSNVVDFDHTLVDMGREADKARQRVDDLKGAVGRLQDLLSNRDAYDNAIQAQNELIWANQVAVDTARNQKASEEDKAAALDASKAALRRSIDETLTYIDTVGGIPPSQETIVKAFIDRGALADAEAWLAHLARARTAVITAKGQGSLGFMKDDAGGHIPPGDVHEVAEKRAEFVNGVLVAGPADVTSGAETGRILGRMGSGGGGGTTIGEIKIIMPPGASGQDVVNAIKKYERTAGPGWRS
jgi:hypothetical protein